MSKQKSKAKDGHADKGAPVDTIAGRSADSLYFVGHAPVRPGDNRFVLRSVARDGAWLELRWETTVGLEGAYVEPGEGKGKLRCAQTFKATGGAVLYRRYDSGRTPNGAGKTGRSWNLEHTANSVPLHRPRRERQREGLREGRRVLSARGRAASALPLRPQGRVRLAVRAA